MIEKTSHPEPEFIKLITYGRKTGLPHIVLLRFIIMDNSFYVVAGHKGSDWYKNAISSGSAKVRLGNLVYPVSADLPSEKEKEDLRALFIRKYGAKIVNLWYKDISNSLKLTPVSQPTFRGFERGENETILTIEGWKKLGKDYLASVSEAFDSASEEYDFTISRNYINTFVRRISIKTLLKYTKREDILLEIGCGTGKEAIEISQHVSKIYITDISEAMLKLASAKIKAYSLDSKVIPLKLRAAEVSKVREITDKKFNMIYSLNGALNCELEIERFAEGAYSLLADGGYLICSIRNKLCISEMLLHALVLQFNKATPRKKQPVMISVGGMDIPTFYYYPSEFVKRLSKYFHPVEIIGLPTLLPPAYLSNYYVRLGRIRVLIEAIEKRLASLFPLNRLGDQTLFVFKKK